ncbi:MAG: hypothetical protein RIS58_1025 [Actinomycetota bacterium]
MPRLLLESNGRWHAEAAVFGSGRNGEHFVAIETGLDDVVTQHVLQRQRLGKWRDIGEVEFVDVAEVIQHARELGRHQIEFFRVQVQTSKPGDFGDHVARQTSTRFGGRHSLSGYWRVSLKSTADSGAIAGGWMPMISRSIPRNVTDDDTHPG